MAVDGKAALCLCFHFFSFSEGLNVHGSASLPALLTQSTVKSWSPGIFAYLIVSPFGLLPWVSFEGWIKEGLLRAAEPPWVDQLVSRGVGRGRERSWGRFSGSDEDGWSVKSHTYPCVCVGSNLLIYLCTQTYTATSICLAFLVPCVVCVCVKSLLSDFDETAEARSFSPCVFLTTWHKETWKKEMEVMSSVIIERGNEIKASDYKVLNLKIV